MLSYLTDCICKSLNKRCSSLKFFHLLVFIFQLKSANAVGDVKAVSPQQINQNCLRLLKML